MSRLAPFAAKSDAASYALSVHAEWSGVIYSCKLELDDKTNF